MPAIFKTFGPFEVTAVNDFDLRHIWKESPGLRYGIGVYILAEKSSKKFLPWYVGRTDRTFGSRLNSHSMFDKIPAHLQGVPVFLFMIARITAKTGKIINSRRKYEARGEELLARRKRHKSIERLEYELIGTCRAINPNLLNLQLKKFHEGMQVPGYIGSWEPEDLDKSAQALQKMLA